MQTDAKKACCSKLLNTTTNTISYVAKVIGLITFSLPEVKHGTAQYKYLEQDKRKANGLIGSCKTIA